MFTLSLRLAVTLWWASVSESNILGCNSTCHPRNVCKWPCDI